MPLKLLRPSLKSATQLLSLVLALPALAACGLLNSELTDSSHGGDTPWGYWGPGAPNNWGSLSEDFTLCATGVRQSPIDLTGYNKDHAVPELAFNYSQDAREVTHNGKVAHVEYGESNSLKVENLTYQLAAVHIHVHAEHQIDRQLFPAEMHLVHRQQDGALGVVGQIYQLGNPDPVVQALIDAYPNPGETLESGFTLNAADYVPEDLGYYRYEGSLTTPPCSEPVDWIVLREIRTISPEQVNRLAALHNGFNHRPIQSGNNRVITYIGPRPGR